MRKGRNLSFDLFWQGLAQPQIEDSRDYEREKLLRVLKRAMQGELTDCQRVCLQKKILEQKQVTQIAEELHVNPSTVTRHIQKACARLNRVVGYSFPKFVDTGKKGK